MPIPSPEQIKKYGTRGGRKQPSTEKATGGIPAPSVVRQNISQKREPERPAKRPSLSRQYERMGILGPPRPLGGMRPKEPMQAPEAIKVKERARLKNIAPDMDSDTIRRGLAGWQKAGLLGVASPTPEEIENFGEKETHIPGALKYAGLEMLRTFGSIPGAFGRLVPGDDVLDQLTENANWFYRNLEQESKDVRDWQKSVAQGNESFISEALGNFGPTAGGLVARLIPGAGLPLAAAAFYQLNAEEIEEKAKRLGVSEEEARQIASFGSILTSIPDVVGLEIMRGNFMAKKLMNHLISMGSVAQGMSRVGGGLIAEGSTEGLQEVVSDLIAEYAAKPEAETSSEFARRMWKKRDEFSEDFWKAASLGAAMGGGVSAIVQPGTAIARGVSGKPSIREEEAKRVAKGELKRLQKQGTSPNTLEARKVVDDVAQKAGLDEDTFASFVYADYGIEPPAEIKEVEAEKVKPERPGKPAKAKKPPKKPSEELRGKGEVPVWRRKKPEIKGKPKGWEEARKETQRKVKEAKRAGTSQARIFGLVDKAAKEKGFAKKQFAREVLRGTGVKYADYTKWMKEGRKPAVKEEPIRREKPVKPEAPTDIYASSGKPFKTKGATQAALKKKGLTDYKPIQITEGKWVGRKSELVEKEPTKPKALTKAKVKKPISAQPQTAEIKEGLGGKKTGIIESVDETTSNAADWLINQDVKQITIRSKLERHKTKYAKLAQERLKRAGWRQWEKDKAVWLPPVEPEAPGKVPAKVKAPEEAPTPEKAPEDIREGDIIRFFPSIKGGKTIEGTVTEVIKNQEGARGFHVLSPTEDRPGNVERVWENKGKVEVVRKAAKSGAPTKELEAKSWKETKKGLSWVKLKDGTIKADFHGMRYGKIEDRRITEDRPSQEGSRYRTSDGETFNGLKAAKAHEMETAIRSRLVEDGYITKTETKAPEKAPAKTPARVPAKVETEEAPLEATRDTTQKHLDYTMQEGSAITFRPSKDNKKKPREPTGKLEKEIMKEIGKGMPFNLDAVSQPLIYSDWARSLGNKRKALVNLLDRRVLKIEARPEKRNVKFTGGGERTIPYTEYIVPTTKPEAEAKAPARVPAKVEAEEEKAESAKEEAIKIDQAYIGSLSPMAKGKLEKSLNKKYNTPLGPMTLKDYIESGKYVKAEILEEPKVKYDRRKFNRMEGAQQKEYEKKLKEKKKTYNVVTADGAYFEIPKIVYAAIPDRFKPEAAPGTKPTPARPEKDLSQSFTAYPAELIKRVNNFLKKHDAKAIGTLKGTYQKVYQLDDGQYYTPKDVLGRDKVGRETTEIRKIAPADIKFEDVEAAQGRRSPYDTSGGIMGKTKPFEKAPAKAKPEGKPVETETSPTGKRTYEAGIPEKQQKALKPKEQKKYFEKELDVAIKNAPEFIPEDPLDTEGIKEEYGMVTIEIPGDGEFGIINSKFHLREVKRRLKKWPTTIRKAKAPGYKPPPIPKRMTKTGKEGYAFEEEIEYYNKFKPREEKKVIEKGDTLAWSNNFFSDSRYAIKLPDKPKLTKAGSERIETSERSRELVQQAKDWAKESKSAKLMGETVGPETDFDIAQIHARSDELEKDALYNAKYVDNILTHHPEAKPSMTSGGVLVFKDKNEIVGIVMPFKEPFSPSKIQAERIKELHGKKAMVSKKPKEPETKYSIRPEPGVEIKNTEDAIIYGSRATPSQIKKLNLIRTRHTKQAEKLRSQGEIQKALNEGFKAQFAREAIEASSGEIGVVNPERLPQIQATAKDIVGWLEKAGIPSSMLKNIRVELKPILKAHAEKLRSTNPLSIAGATTLNHFHALIELATASPNMETIEKTTYHEAFHVLSKWVLPSKEYDQVIRHYENEEAAADAFAEYVKAKSLTRLKYPSRIKRTFFKLKRLFDIVKNGLSGKGFARPEDIFGSLITQSYKKNGYTAPSEAYSLNEPPSFFANQVDNKVNYAVKNAKKHEPRNKNRMSMERNRIEKNPWDVETYYSVYGRSLRDMLSRFAKKDGKTLDKARLKESTGEEIEFDTVDDMIAGISRMQATQDLANNYPAFAKLVDTFVGKQAAVSQEEEQFRDLLEGYYGDLSHKERKELNPVFDELQSLGIEVSDKLLKEKHKLSEKQIKAWRSVQNVMSKIHDDRSYMSIVSILTNEQQGKIDINEVLKTLKKRNEKRSKVKTDRGRDKIDEEMARSLQKLGFTREQVLGKPGWKPLTAQAQEIIAKAKRKASKEKSQAKKTRIMDKANKEIANLGKAQEKPTLLEIADWGIQGPYLPHDFEETPWRIKLEEKDGTEWLVPIKNLESKYLLTKRQRKEAARRAGNEIIKDLRAKGKERGGIDELAKKPIIVRHTQIPMEMREAGHEAMMASVLGSAMNEAKGNIKSKSKEKAKNIDMVEEAVQEALHEQYARKSFARHFLSRKNVKGYRTDFERVIPEYISGWLRYKHKYFAVQESTKILGKEIDHNRQPILWLRATHYVRDMLSKPAHSARGFKRIAGMYFLAADLSAAALNFTQNYTHATALLGELKTGKSATKELAKAQTEIAQEYSKSRFKRRLIFKSKDSLFAKEPNLMEAVKNSVASGELDPQLLGERTGLWRNKFYQSFITGLERKLYIGFAGAESWNRISTYIAAYRRAEQATRKGLERRLMIGETKDNRYSPEEYARRYAAWAVRETHFLYGKESRPEVIRDLGTVGNMFYTFMSYPMGNLSFIKNRANQALDRSLPSEHRKASLKVLGANLGMVGAFGGLNALPFMFLLKGLWGLMDDDPEDEWETKMRKMLRENVGGDMAQVIGRGMWRGIPSIFGNDMSWRVEGTDILDIPIGLQTGRTIWKRLKKGKRFLDQKDYWGATFHAMPDMLMNPYKAIVGMDYGGERAGAPPIQYSASEAWMKAFGFTPTREAETYKTTRLAKERMLNYRDELESFAERYYAAIRKGDYDEVRQVHRDVHKYNRKEMEKEPYSVYIPMQKVITSVKLRRAAREEGYIAKLPKYMQRYERQISGKSYGIAKARR